MEFINREAECSDSESMECIEGGDIEDLIADEEINEEGPSFYNRMDNIPTMFGRREPEAPRQEPDYLHPRPARMADENGVQPGDVLPTPHPMKKKRKGIRSRNWVFTTNNYSYFPRLLPMMKWIRYGEEIGVENNTPHLQGCIQFNNPIEKPSTMHYMGEVVQWMFESHWERMKGSIQSNLDYTGKDATFENGKLIEFGERPLSNADARLKGKNASREKYLQMIQDAKDGKMQKIQDECPGEYLRMYRTLNALRDQATWKGFKSIQGWTDSPHLWVVGDTGTAKSATCWQIWQDKIYRKDCDKWFDGYPLHDPETILLIDDFEPIWVGKGKLKVWADRYPFRAHIKNTSVMIRPKKVVVTSNYRIEECGFDPKDLGPMMRRFKQISANELKAMYPLVKFYF